MAGGSGKTVPVWRAVLSLKHHIWDRGLIGEQNRLTGARNNMTDAVLAQGCRMQLCRKNTTN